MSTNTTTNPANATNYTCCGTITRTDDPMPTCDVCGLFVYDVAPATPAPSARSLRFVVDGRDYIAGDDRAYDVYHHGVHLGMVEPGFGFEGGRVWDFSSDRDNRRGSGRTRAAAVRDAYGA